MGHESRPLGLLIYAAGLGSAVEGGAPACQGPPSSTMTEWRPLARSAMFSRHTPTRSSNELLHQSSPTITPQARVQRPADGVGLRTRRVIAEVSVPLAAWLD